MLEMLRSFERGERERGLCEAEALHALAREKGPPPRSLQCLGHMVVLGVEGLSYGRGTPVHVRCATRDGPFCVDRPMTSPPQVKRYRGTSLMRNRNPPRTTIWP